MAEKTVQLNVYFPPDIAAKIKAMAEKERRSLSAQMLVLVEKALDD